MKPVLSCILQLLLLNGLLIRGGLGASMWAASQTDQLAPASSLTPKTPPFQLEDGTPVKLHLQRTISSADAHVDDRVDFDVLEEIKVNDILVIPKGSVAWGTVTEAQAKRRMARGGKLNLNIDAVRLADAEKAPLRAVKDAKGGGHTGAMTGAIVATSLVFFPAAPLFLFMHGKDITIPKGTEITAYINGSMKLDQTKFSGSSTEAQTGPQPVAVTGGVSTIVVKSVPDGADISVDAEYRGSTPSSLSLAAGSHTISIEKKGFKKWQRVMNLSGGSSITVNADLQLIALADAVKFPQANESSDGISEMPPPAAANTPAQTPPLPQSPAPRQNPAPPQNPVNSHLLSFGASGTETDTGFKITAVREGSPAAQIFLRPGDVITGIDGTVIKSEQDINSAMAASASGKVKVAGLTKTTFGWVDFSREVKVR